MLDGLAWTKIEPERLSSPRKVDRQMASAAGGERKSQANEDDCPDVLHFEPAMNASVFFLAVLVDLARKTDRNAQVFREVDSVCLSASMPNVRKNLQVLRWITETTSIANNGTGQIRRFIFRSHPVVAGRRRGRATGRFEDERDHAELMPNCKGGPQMVSVTGRCCRESGHGVPASPRTTRCMSPWQVRRRGTEGKGSRAPVRIV